MHPGPHNPKPPNPFASNADFVDWLNEPIGPHTALTRYLASLHSGRPDLQAVFPDPVNIDSDRYLQWAATDQVDPVPAMLVPTRPPRHPLFAAPQPASTPLPGLNIVRSFNARM